MYRMVWVVFFSLGWFSSLSSTANTMGNGKQISRLPRFSTRVFLMAVQNSLALKASRKYFSPTQGLAAIPLKMLYFLNAITSPLRGR